MYEILQFKNNVDDNSCSEVLANILKIILLRIINTEFIKNNF